MAKARAADGAAMDAAKAAENEAQRNFETEVQLDEDERDPYGQAPPPTPFGPEMIWPS